MITVLFSRTSGSIKKLFIGDPNSDDDGGKLARLVSGPSSVESLELYDPILPLHAPYLVNNTHLLELTISISLHHFTEDDHDVSRIASMVEHNKTLHRLELNLSWDQPRGCNLMVFYIGYAHSLLGPPA